MSLYITVLKEWSYKERSHKMTNAVAWILATIVTLPLLAFYLIYLVSVKTTKDKKSSLKLAVDISTVSFIAAVYFIAFEIWSQSLLWLILLIILVAASIFTFIHWKVSEDIQFLKLVKGIWRLNFLLFFVMYFILSLYGLYIRIFSIV